MLKEKIAAMRKVLKVFQKYQYSDMESTKWMMLDHVVYDLSQLGDVTYMIADYY